MKNRLTAKKLIICDFQFDRNHLGLCQKKISSNKKKGTWVCASPEAELRTAPTVESGMNQSHWSVPNLMMTTMMMVMMLLPKPGERILQLSSIVSQPLQLLGKLEDSRLPGSPLVDVIFS